MYKYINETKNTLKLLLHLLKRLIKLKSKLYKINRNYYGINRHIETLIDNSRKKLSESFIWLDKAFYQLKKDIKEKENYNKIIG